MQRLQKRIANSGYTSRRKAEKLIQEGKVKVNGKIITNLGFQVNDKDDVEIDKVHLSTEEKEYYLLYKPEKTITTVKDDKNRKIVLDYVPSKKRIYPVGRLDYDTTGILILTNDGELSNILMHPSHEIEKTYLAKVQGFLNPEEMQKLKSGMIIEGRKIIPKRVKLKKKNNQTSNYEITITEGRNHIVKKIFNQVNHPVIKLKRTAYAFLNLEGLKKGEYRKLTMKEVKKLYSLK